MTQPTVSQPTLYLLCGLPGAGKTTRANQILGVTTAVLLSVDDWITGLDKSLLDYEFRFRLQDIMRDHAGDILRAGPSVIIEFGSWAREDREKIRAVGAAAGARTELHFLDAPLDELVQRVRTRGGEGAEGLANDVLIGGSDQFERPTPDEIARFDRYVGPGDEWTSA